MCEYLYSKRVMEKHLRHLCSVIHSLPPHATVGLAVCMILVTLFLVSTTRMSALRTLISKSIRIVKSHNIWYYFGGTTSAHARTISLFFHSKTSHATSSEITLIHYHTSILFLLVTLPILTNSYAICEVVLFLFSQTILKCDLLPLKLSVISYHHFALGI